MKQTVKLYTDGACRGNGREEADAAIGLYILDEDGKEIKRYVKHIGKSTNNQAEYRALIKGLELAAMCTSGQVDCFSDSQLVVNQMNEVWKVKNTKLKSLWIKACALEDAFERVTYTHLRRCDTKIARADAMANDALDRA